MAPYKLYLPNYEFSCLTTLKLSFATRYLCHDILSYKRTSLLFDITWGHRSYQTMDKYTYKKTLANLSYYGQSRVKKMSTAEVWQVTVFVFYIWEWRRLNNLPLPPQIIGSRFCKIKLHDREPKLNYCYYIAIN